MFKFSFLFLVFCPNLALAEYRVFELLIFNKSTSETRTVLSTLDPLQFKYYYTVYPDEVVRYTQTWMCKGNTSERPFCPNPKTLESQDQAPVPNSPNN